jgi:hypothetical protein
MFRRSCYHEGHEGPQKKNKRAPDKIEGLPSTFAEARPGYFLRDLCVLCGLKPFGKKLFAEMCAATT